MKVAETWRLVRSGSRGVKVRKMSKGQRQEERMPKTMVERRVEWQGCWGMTDRASKKSDRTPMTNPNEKAVAMA